MEHHSNDLPWRGRATVVRAKTTGDGRLDEEDVDRLIDEYGDRIALVTVSGASNVTGFLQPVHRLAAEGPRDWRQDCGRWRAAGRTPSHRRQAGSQP
jgi:hypothetical protein